MEGFVKITDLMQHLRENGLVIVRAHELAQAKALEAEQKRWALLAKKSMTYAQAAFVLNISKATLTRRVADGTVNEKTETLSRGGVRHIMTSAVKRLGGIQ